MTGSLIRVREDGREGKQGGSDKLGGPRAERGAGNKDGRAGRKHCKFEETKGFISKQGKH